MKAAAAVLGASMLFFLGVLTGIGRRESVPPPSAIPLGAIDSPAASPSAAPEGSKRTTTTTTAKAPPATVAPAGPVGPTTPTGVTATTSPASTTGPTATSSTSSTTGTTGTTGPGQVQQVDNQVDCRSNGKRGKGQRQPCPSTTSSTAEAPGGGRNR